MATADARMEVSFSRRAEQQIEKLIEVVGQLKDKTHQGDPSVRYEVFDVLNAAGIESDKANTIIGELERRDLIKGL